MKVYKSTDRIIHFLGKGILYIIGCLLTVYICFTATEWFWPELNGSYSLGNGIYMLEWDGGGRIIVQGSNIHGNTCYGGSQLIPTYENQCDSIGNFVEYVIDAKSNDSWIIAVTNNTISKQRKYYILDKRYDLEKMTAEDIINNRIESFTDSSAFAKRCLNDRINIKW